MKKVYTPSKVFRRTLLGILAIYLLCISGCAHGQIIGSGRNSLTLINESGSHALVKIVGPGREIVEVPDRSKVHVRLAGGEYLMYVRYGKSPSYRYTKGEAFTIKETSTTYTEASLTLHGVKNGNYRTQGSSENEFNDK